jgi:hypothetical protein
MMKTLFGTVVFMMGSVQRGIGKISMRMAKRCAPIRLFDEAELAKRDAAFGGVRKSAFNRRITCPRALRWEGKLMHIIEHGIRQLVSAEVNTPQLLLEDLEEQNRCCAVHLPALRLQNTEAGQVGRAQLSLYQGSLQRAGHI